MTNNIDTYGSQSFCLNIISGNRLKDLAARLGEFLSKNPLPPLMPEVVLVQSPAIGRWLSLELAKHNNICANLNIFLPNAYMHELFSCLLPDAVSEESSPYSSWAMTWRIMEALPKCLKMSAFTEISRYLEDDMDARKRFGLSARIAGVFDKYLLFRPDMILKWEQGREKHWQALLWRDISAKFAGLHRPALRQAFFKALDNTEKLPEAFPKQISVFGVFALPLFHLEVFSKIGQRLPVNLFHVNPCKQYWGDIYSDRQITKITTEKLSASPQDLYLEKGNSLLASMGAVGRDFLTMIYNSPGQVFEDFRPPLQKTLLGRIQHDIFELEEPGLIGDKISISNNDNSVSIHSCHGEMREMEVLYDHILRFFDQSSRLEPHHIIVMAPDIEVYAPYIQAVFDSPRSEKKIPFSISGREMRSQNQTVNAFFELVDLCQGRFETVEVLDFASLPSVARRFDFSEKDLAILNLWVAETRICWGPDDKSRIKLGLPGFLENTWRAGMDRLFLGYAMEGENDRDFAKILPLDGFFVEDGPLLGRFANFLDALFGLAQDFSQPRNLEKWAKLLGRVVEDFFDQDLDDIQDLQKAVARLAQAEDEWGFSQKAGLGVVRACMTLILEQQKPTHGFLRRGVNFCSLRQAAGIPFPIVCLVGVNDNVFPRQDSGLGFDLMAKKSRPGDRTPRGDDRFAFLQSVLSAEKSLYISYNGQDLQDNQPLCPSAMVSELIDYIETNFEIPEKNVVTIHKLHAFSSAYFSDISKSKALFSYSKELYDAAIAVRQNNHVQPLFFDGPLDEPDNPAKEMDLETLCRFYKSPAKFLLKERLGVLLEEHQTMADVAEPFDLSGLEKYGLAQILVEKGILGIDLSDFFNTAKSMGRLPHGKMGSRAYENITQEIKPFIEKIKKRLAIATKAVDADIMVDGFKITARLSPFGKDGLFMYRSTSIKPGDRLRAWLHHLALCASVPKSEAKTTFAGLDKILRFSFIDKNKALKHLSGLLGLYRQGLVTPLLFFPDTSFAYAEAISDKNYDTQRAIGVARKKWEPGYNYSGESKNSYYQCAFESLNLLNDKFCETAMEIFEPMIENQVEERR